ncbi:MAG: sigma-54-dependent transcriptional regulator [Syntrophobacteraceae bacterium]
MAEVLIIDDDFLIRETLSEVVMRLGHHVTGASTLAEGLQAATSHPYDVVFLDVRMPDGNGLDILPAIRETASSPEIIIMTGFGEADGAELAIKSGAWDYLKKPSSIKAMTLPLERALRYREQKQANAVTAPVKALKREAIIGNSPKMAACYELLAQAASSDANVLITGETGTGKELFAWAIHHNSQRSGFAFVVVDCAALPATLVESVLFGHERGAFTGAFSAREGMILQADRGTLFLDEVGELLPSMQRSFLRVLQERRFRPVGGSQEKASDFRTVAATNRNLQDMVQQNLFRQDLLFRLQTITIELPPLRERREDIKELAVYHMTRMCKRCGASIKGMSPELIEALTLHNWPGNVRELFNAMEQVYVAARNDSVLYPKHLPDHIRIGIAKGRIDSEDTRGAAPPASPARAYSTFREFRSRALSRAEHEYLSGLMSLTRGNIAEACRISKVSQSRLYELLKKHGLTRGSLMSAPRFPEEPEIFPGLS